MKKIAIVSKSKENYEKFLLRKGLQAENCVWVNSNEMAQGLEFSSFIIDELSKDLNMEILRAHVRP